MTPTIKVTREKNIIILECDSKRTAKKIEKNLKKAYRK